MDLCGFDGFGSVMEEKVRRPVASDGNGLDGSRGPIRSLQLGTSKFR